VFCGVLTNELSPSHQTARGNRTGKSRRVCYHLRLNTRKSWRDFPYRIRTKRDSKEQAIDSMALPTGFEPVLQP
jgi:hypothetical protein